MKSIFQSKVFYVAVLQAVLGAVLTFDGSTTTPYLGVALILKSILDVVLRFMTDTGVTLTE